jgi:hypothetical protein
MNEAATPELRPCSCGNTMCGIAHSSGLFGTFYFVECSSCGEHGVGGNTIEEAVRNWNMEQDHLDNISSWLTSLLGGDAE